MTLTNPISGWLRAVVADDAGAHSLTHPNENGLAFTDGNGGACSCAPLIRVGLANGCGCVFKSLRGMGNGCGNDFVGFVAMAGFKTELELLI